MTEWIRVDQQLPPEGMLVLTLDGEPCDAAGYNLDYIIIINSETVWARRIEDDYGKVKWRMPLPKLPAEEWVDKIKMEWSKE